MEQINHITKLSYQGRNQAELSSVAKKNGYKSNEWLTFLQARDKGLKIKKGEHGMSVFKGFESFSDKDEKDGKIKTVSRPLGFSKVFNLDQTERSKDEVNN